MENISRQRMGRKETEKETNEKEKTRDRNKRIKRCKKDIITGNVRVAVCT
jgi:hypothetical protein